MAPRPQTGHLRVSALRMSIELDGVAIDDILSRRTGYQNSGDPPKT
jgi:hypothetical protein